jgi:thiamine-phosphate pyrophosphorylase
VAIVPIEGVYAITPDLEDTRLLHDQVRSILLAGVRIVQYRSKTADAERRAEQAQMLTALCHRFAACLIVNDDVELADHCGADGVHLGRDDPAVTEARRILGARRLIGVSCYAEVARAKRAASDGADYVAFGSFFLSSTKPAADNAPLAVLADARRTMHLPVVAIGGITADNAALAIGAGADAVAVVNGLFGASNVHNEARRLIEAAARALHSPTGTLPIQQK